MVRPKNIQTIFFPGVFENHLIHTRGIVDTDGSEIRSGEADRNKRDRIRKDLLSIRVSFVI